MVRREIKYDRVGRQPLHDTWTLPYINDLWMTSLRDDALHQLITVSDMY